MTVPNPSGPAAGRGRPSVIGCTAASLVLLALFAAVVLALAPGWPWERASIRSEPHVPSDVPGAMTSAMGSETGADGPRAVGTERLPLAPRPALRIGEGRVRVVRASDGRALPGAEVWFRDDAGELSALHSESSERDPFAAVRAGGRRCVADAEGLVVIATRSDQIGVAGVYEDLAGFTWLEPPEPDGGHVLAMSPRMPLVVEVVDGEGRPVAGAPIEVQVWRGWWSCGRSPVGATDAAGRLVIEHCAPLLRGGNVTKAMIAVACPGLDAAAVAFDHVSIPAEPVRVVLPAAGRVEIVVETEGGLPLRGVRASLFPPTVRHGESSLDATLVTDGSGRVVVPFVGLGRRLRLRVLPVHPAAFHVDFDGPTRAGETVRVVAQPERERAMLLAQLVDERGAPLAGVPFDLELEATSPDGRTRSERSAVHTHPDGRLVCVLGDLVASAATLRGHLTAAGCLRRADPRATGFSLAGPLAAGVRDLGVLTVLRAAPTMSGTLASSDGRPVAHATATFPGAASPAPRFQLDGDGRFAVFALAVALPAVLRVTAPGCLPTDVPVRAGAHDLRVELHRAASVQLAVLLDTEHDAVRGSLRCELLAGDGSRREAQVAPAPGGGRAHFASLPEGVYAVRLWLAGHPEPLHAADGLAAGPAAGWDRHAAADLRGRLRGMRVAVRSAGSGRPLTDALVFVGERRAWQGALAREGVRCDHDGVARVAVLGDTLALVAEAPGHAALPWTSPPQDLTLALQPLPELELRLVGFESPPGARLSVELTAVGLGPEPWVSGRRRSDERRSYAEIVDGRGRTRAPALGEIAATLSIAVPGAPVVSRRLRVEPAVLTPETRGLALQPAR